MKTLRILREQAEKHVVMAFGRMNPPTIGHAKLVDKVKATANKLGADHSIVLSHSQDSKKNPLTADQKLQHAQRFFPNTNLSVASKESPTLMHHAANLHKQGYQHLTMVAGSDRVDEYKKLLHKYNGKFDEKGNGFHFKSINVVSAGDRDPDAEGAAGMSASKMREHAKNNDFESFQKGVPDHVSTPHAKELFKHVRDGMNLHEALDRELYMLGKLFHVGDSVEDLVTEETGTIEYRGTNYVTVNVGGTITKRWLNEVLSLVEPHILEEAPMSENTNPDGTRKSFRDVAKKASAPADHKPINMPVADKADPYGRKNRPKTFGQFYHGMNPGGSVNKEEVEPIGEVETLEEGQQIRYVGAKEIKKGHHIRLGRHVYQVSNVNREGGKISFGVSHKDGSYWYTNAMHPESTVQHVLKEDAEEFDELLDESLVAAARHILGKDADPKYKAAASCMLQGSCSKLKAHLEGPGRSVKVKIMQALHKHGGSEGQAWANKLGYLGEEMALTEGKFKKGDKVNVLAGPHQQTTHEIIHAHSDGSYNVRPLGIGPAHIKYKLGAARAQEHQLKKIDEETVSEGVLSSIGAALKPKSTGGFDSEKEMEKARAEVAKRWPNLNKKIQDAKAGIKEEATLTEMDDVTSTAKKIGVGNLDPVMGKKKTMADGKKKTFRSVASGMAKARSLAEKGMRSVTEDVRDLHHAPMIHLVNSYSKGDKKVHVWQNHYGGYDYDVHHHNHKTGESHVENHKTSYDEIHAKLKGQGFKPMYESVQPLDEQAFGTLLETAPPGMEHVVKALKKKYPNDEGRAFAIAWSQYNKKKMHEEVESLDESTMAELAAAMPKHWKDTEIVHGERHRSGGHAIVVRHKMTHGADTHYSTMIKHPDGDWHHIDSWGSLERAKQQIHEEVDMDKNEIKDQIFDLAQDILSEGQFAHLIKRDKEIEKKVTAHWKKTTGQKTVQPRDFGRAKAAWKEHETNKSLGLEESALEVPDIHIDAAPYSVVGGEKVGGKVIKYVRQGNFLAPISVVIEEEMWKDADGNIFRFNGQAAAQQAIHALLSGGGSHVAAPKMEDGGDTGGDGGGE